MVDIEKAKNFFPGTSFVPRALLQGSTRPGVKLDFIAGLFLKATGITGVRGFRGVEAALGEGEEHIARIVARIEELKGLGMTPAASEKRVTLLALRMLPKSARRSVTRR
jgi:aromatic ring hydroxylase